MRVTKHPILDDLDESKKVTLYYNGQPIEALEGEPIASALMNAGIRVFRTTAKKHDPRGIFCTLLQFFFLYVQSIPVTPS